MATAHETPCPGGTIYRSTATTKSRSGNPGGLRKRLRTSTGIMVTAGLSLAATAGVAFAYVVATESQTGTGTVIVNGTVSMTLTATTQPATEPGMGFGPGKTTEITIAVTNDNARTLRLQKVVQNGTVRVTNNDAAHDACAGGSVTALPTVIGSGDDGLDVQPNAASQVRVVLSMANNASAECQGAGFRVPLKVMGRVL